jgi:biopolymer transport protein TolR
MNAPAGALAGAVRGATRCDINVTPLVDVCLTLLIIFMVVTPIIDREVPLPRTDRPERIDGRPRAVTVTAAVPVRVRIEGDPQALSLEELLPRAAALHEAEPKTGLLLRANAGIDFGAVRRALAALRAAGDRGLAVAAEPKMRRAGTEPPP